MPEDRKKPQPKPSTPKPKPILPAEKPQGSTGAIQKDYPKKAPKTDKKGHDKTR